MTTLLTSLLAIPALAQLNLSTSEVEISDAVQSKKILITFNGDPVLPNEIKKIVSGVTKTGRADPEGTSGTNHFSNYTYMFDFQSGEDGYIVIKPKKDQVEVGKYDLFVHTVHGTVKGLINANMRDSIPVSTHTPLNLSDFNYALSFRITPMDRPFQLN